MNSQTQAPIKKPSDTRAQKVARRILLAICVINGIAAPISGVLMILSPGGELMQMQEVLIQMQTWPGASIFFQDLKWSGAALILVNGATNLFCLGLWLNKRKSYTVVGIICGVLLIIWCIWEMAFIPNSLTALYLLVGVAQTTAAVYCTITR